MKPMNSKRGITLMELMVVIAIMGILSTVAVPKLFGAGEKAREKIDLMKLYDLRNAINLALIEDLDAMTKYTTIDPKKNKSTLNDKLANGLSNDVGATLFVIELHRDYAINVQNSHNNANNKYNVSAMIGYFVITKVDYFSAELNSCVLPVCAFGLIGFILGHVTMSIFSVSGDALIHSFLLDEEINKGLPKAFPELQKFMSEER